MFPGWRMNIGTEHAALLDGGIRYAELKGQVALTIRDWNNGTQWGFPWERQREILAEISGRQWLSCTLNGTCRKGRSRQRALKSFQPFKRSMRGDGEKWRFSDGYPTPHQS